MAVHIMNIPRRGAGGGEGLLTHVRVKGCYWRLDPVPCMDENNPKYLLCVGLISSR